MKEYKAEHLIVLEVRAQGLNNAVEDAKLYVDAIKNVVYDGKDLKASIDAYDKSSYTWKSRYRLFVWANEGISQLGKCYGQPLDKEWGLWEVSLA